MRRTCSSLRAILLAGTALAGGVPPSRAHADSVALTVDVEIAEKGTGTSGESATMTLALAGEHGCASTEARHGPLKYEVRVCHETGDTKTPTLSFVIDRQADAERYSGVKRVRSTVRIAAGHRATVSRMAHADGASTEIAATVH